MTDNNNDVKADDTAQGNSGGEPQFVTKDQLVDTMSEMINKALTNRNKQVEGRVEKQIADLQKSFKEELAALLSKASDTTKEDPETVSKNKKESPKAEDPMVKELTAKLAAVEKALETTKLEKAADRERAKDRDLRQKLSDELVKSGIDPTRVRHAVGLLIDADKRVRYVDDTDEIVFTDPDEQSESDLRAGVKSWLKTEDAKIYMPAKGVKGSGDRQTNRTSTNKSSDSVNSIEEVGNSLLEVIRDL